jgi:hypothetical protein
MRGISRSFAFLKKRNYPVGILLKIYVKNILKNFLSFDLITKRANKISYLDINDGHYRRKQIFIVELGVHSDEDHQR